MSSLEDNDNRGNVRRTVGATTAYINEFNMAVSSLNLRLMNFIDLVMRHPLGVDPSNIRDLRRIQTYLNNLRPYEQGRTAMGALEREFQEITTQYEQGSEPHPIPPLQPPSRSPVYPLTVEEIETLMERLQATLARAA